jgi:hypothetical protein
MCRHLNQWISAQCAHCLRRKRFAIRAANAVLPAAPQNLVGTQWVTEEAANDTFLPSSVRLMKRPHREISDVATIRMDAAMGFEGLLSDAEIKAAKSESFESRKSTEAAISLSDIDWGIVTDSNILCTQLELIKKRLRALSEAPSPEEVRSESWGSSRQFSAHEPAPVRQQQPTALSADLNEVLSTYSQLSEASARYQQQAAAVAAATAAATDSVNPDSDYAAARTVDPETNVGGGLALGAGDDLVAPAVPGGTDLFCGAQTPARTAAAAGAPTGRGRGGSGRGGVRRGGGAARPAVTAAPKASQPSNTQPRTAVSSKSSAAPASSSASAVYLPSATAATGAASASSAPPSRPQLPAGVPSAMPTGSVAPLPGATTEAPQQQQQQQSVTDAPSLDGAFSGPPDQCGTQ